MSSRLLSRCLPVFVQNNKNSGVLPLSLILEWVTMLRPREHVGLSGHLPELEVHPMTFHEAAEGMQVRSKALFGSPRGGQIKAQPLRYCASPIIHSIAIQLTRDVRYCSTYNKQRKSPQ